MKFSEMVTEARTQVKEITVEELQKEDMSSLILIDVREPSEYEAGHVKGAINIPRGVIEMELDLNPNYSNRSHSLVLMCKSGGRSALAAVSIEKLGFNQVSSLMGGFQAWEAQGFNIVR